MIRRRTVEIIFDARVSLENRGDHWAAYVEPLGITVYGDTRAEAENRVQQAINFFVKRFGSGDEGVQKIRNYLDSHGVPNTIVEDDRVSPISFTHPISVPLEIPAAT